jgi:hypothetical protein
MNSAQRTRTISKKKRVRATEKKEKEREHIHSAKEKQTQCKKENDLVCRVVKHLHISALDNRHGSPNQSVF